MVLVLAGLFILGVAVFSITSLFDDSTPQPTVQGSAATEGEVLLSWGKFNYVPEVITAKKGVPLRIRADMARLTGCYQSLVVPALGVSESFSTNHDVIEFTPQKSGTFKFTCRMGMGSGTLVVE